MEVQTVFQLVALLLLGICTRGGKAQVECYSEGQCPENVPELIIGEFNSAKECCILDEALSWQTAEPCAACLIYGWKETYSEARIGDTVTLTVGTIKGSPEGRVILGVEYNNTEVSVDATFDPTRFIWAAVDLSLQVRVLDDGQPLQEDKNITLTLAKIAGGKSSDIIVTEAIITVRAQKIPDSLSCTATGLSEVAINCSGVEPDTFLQCSFSGGPLHSCNVPILLTSNVSPPGSRFNVTILASTGGEDTVTYDITNTKTDVSASVPPLEVVLTGGSPRVTESSVEAEFVTTRPVTGVRCFLRYENKNDYKDCSSGSVSFTGLKPGRYVLKIFAYNKLTDVAAIKRVVNV